MCIEIAPLSAVFNNLAPISSYRLIISCFLEAEAIQISASKHYVFRGDGPASATVDEDPLP